MINKDFSVRAAIFPTIEKRLEKLNRKAVKLGIEPAVIVNKKDTFEVKYVFDPLENNSQRKVIIPKIDFTVNATEIKIGDYEFIATLDHRLGTPIVNSVAGKTIPKKFLNAKPVCMHCGTARYRTETFLFKQGKQIIQVGRQCLKAFFGIDPTATLDWFGSLYELGDEDERTKNFGDNDNYFSTEYVVAMGLVMVERNGFISRKTADSRMEKNPYVNVSTTSDDCKYYLMTHNVAGMSDKQIENIRSTRLATLEKTEEAIKIIAWGVEHFSKDETSYGNNMKNLLALENVPSRYFGYVVSVIAAYNVENAKKREYVASANEFIGKVGEKITAEVVVKKVIPFEGSFGMTYINILSEANTGNNLVWFASNSDLKEGESVKIKGTVKAHNVRDSKNQTVLTRCKVVA